MWVHETQRVYGDRLLEEKDFDTLSKLHTDVVKKVFEVSWVGCRAECGACCGCEPSCGCVGRGVRRIQWGEVWHKVWGQNLAKRSVRWGKDGK